MFVQHTLRFTKRCHCGTKNKSMGDISDKRKQTQNERVYSRALKQDVGITGLRVLLGVCIVRKEEVSISLPRKVCNHFLKLFTCVSVIN